jgi:hypothetical protein
MRTLNIPHPPNPVSPQFKNNPVAFNKAAHEWMTQAKGAIEQAHNSVATPCGQQLRASAFTTNTTITGTSTGTDVANFLCSLVATLTNKGILSPTISIGQNQ